MTEERYRLAIGHIREMKKETSVNERFRDYFRKMAEVFFIMIDELKESTSNQEATRRLPWRNWDTGTSGYIRISCRRTMR